MEGLIVLGFFMIVVGIPVLGGIWLKAHQQRMKFRERELELLGAQTAEKAAQYAAHTERLEQRVRTLEKIVTDDGYDTAAKIEALREPQRIEQDNA